MSSAAVAQFRHNQWIYLMHVVHLIAPGHPVPVFTIDANQPGDLSAWATDELTLLIEEGRRQSDRQQAQLEEIRGRAQWLFTVGAAVLGALGAGLIGAKPALGYTIISLAGMLLLVLGLGGAAAILTVKADFNTIHVAVLSKVEQPVDHKLAASYSRMMAVGENTVATRLTVFRQAVVYSLAGGYLGLIGALLAG
jgi:hypothetical protein